MSTALRTVDDVFKSFSDLFEPNWFFKPSKFTYSDYFRIFSNTSSDGKTYDIKVEMPGCNKDDVKVTYVVVENLLELTFDVKGKKYQHWVQNISRLDFPNMSCNVKDGVLNISIPLLEETKYETVEIEVG
jgi:HSP20 family molecular chaperone IbpA